MDCQYILSIFWWEKSQDLVTDRVRGGGKESVDCPGFSGRRLDGG